MAKKPKVERSKAGRTKEETKAADIVAFEKTISGMDPDKFENESDGEASDRTEAMDREEVEAIDEMLEGKDEKFNKLKY